MAKGKSNPTNPDPKNKWWQRPSFWLKVILLLLGVGGPGAALVFYWSGTSQQTINSPGSISIQNTGNLEINPSPPKDYDQVLKDIKKAIDEVRDELKKLTEKNLGPKLPNAEDALLQLGKGNTEPAKQIFKDILARKKREGEVARQEAAAAARHLGALAFLSNNEEALHAYREAVTLDPDNLEGQNQLANVLVRKGQLSEAENVLLKVLSIAESQKDVERQAITLQNLGVIYSHDGKTQRAEEMFRRSLELNESLHRKKGAAANYNSLAFLYFKEGDLRQAEDMSHKSIRIYEDLQHSLRDASDITAKGNSVITLGRVYFKAKNYASAEQKFCTGLDLYSSVNNKGGMANTYALLGDLYAVRGQAPIALALFRQSLKLFEEVKVSKLYEEVKKAVQSLSSFVPQQEKGIVVQVCGARIS